MPMFLYRLCCVVVAGVLATATFLQPVAATAQTQTGEAPAPTPENLFPQGMPEHKPAAPIDLTDPKRWSETAYGISLRPPEGWETELIPHDGTDFAWSASDSRRISFKVVYSKTPMQLDFAAQSALVEMGFSSASPHVRDLQQRYVGNRPAAVMLFDVQEKDDPNPWFYGHAIVMLEQVAAVVIKVQSNGEQAERAAADFETVLASLHVPLAQELEQTRRMQMDLGVAWKAGLPPNAILNAVPQNQWYQLKRGGNHVGYRQITRGVDQTPDLTGQQTKGISTLPPGAVVTVRTRQLSRDMTLDQQLLVYELAATETEIWEFIQTLRPAGDLTQELPSHVSAESNSPTWLEQGARAPRAQPTRDSHMQVIPRNVLTVTHEVPPDSKSARNVEAHEQFVGRPQSASEQQGLRGRAEEHSWETPPLGYLSQIDVLGLPSLMPAEPVTMAFYAYDSGTASMGLRTIRVTPDPTPDAMPGDFVVYDRPAPRSAEIRHRFTADRQLIETIWPNGLTAVPTTLEALRTQGDLPPSTQTTP